MIENDSTINSTLQNAGAEPYISSALLGPVNIQEETLDGRPSPSNSIGSATLSDHLYDHHSNTKKTLLTIIKKQYAGKVVPLNHREIIAFAVAGMIRGNVSWAQALQVREEDHIIASTTLTVVLATIFLFQLILPLVVKLLGLKPDEEEEEHESKEKGNKQTKGEKDDIGLSDNGKEKEIEQEGLRSKVSQSPQTEEGGNQANDRQGIFSKVLLMFHTFDKNYMRPYFSGTPPNPEFSSTKTEGDTYMALPQDE